MLVPDATANRPFGRSKDVLRKAAWSKTMQVVYHCRKEDTVRVRVGTQGECCLLRAFSGTGVWKASVT